MSRICPNCEYRGEAERCPTDGFPTLVEGVYADDTPELIGKVFADRYEVIELIGSGAMGWVFKVRHTVTGGELAMKVMRKLAGANRAHAKRFFAEAQTSMALREPNTLRVFDTGSSDDGFLYLVMEYLEGRTLAEVLAAEQRIAPSYAAHIARQVCFSLQEAHAKDLVHRDLKPENIFLTSSAADSSFVKVLDFGIAKAINEPEGGSQTALTEAGATLGTPRYMSPEQASATELDHRSDLYSLGVILYEMLSGVAPFEKPTSMGVMLAHVSEQPEPLPEEIDGEPIPAELRTLTEQLLAKDPDERPRSAAEVAARLARCAEIRHTAHATRPRVEATTGKPVTNAIPTRVAPVVSSAGAVDAPPRSKRRYLLAVAAVLLLGGAGAALLVTLGPSGAPAGPETPAPVVAGSAVVATPRSEVPPPPVPEPEPEPPVVVPDAAASVPGARPDTEADAQPDSEQAADAHDAQAGPTAREPTTGSKHRDAAVSRLTDEMINAVFRKNRSAFLRCARKAKTYLKEAAVGASEISVKLTITIKRSGGVSKARLAPARHEGSSFGRCMLARARKLRFPRNRDRSPTVTFPFTFTVGGS